MPKPKGRKPKKRAYPRLEHTPGQYHMTMRLMLPPSVNSIWIRGKHGQFLSPNYRKWRQDNIKRIPKECAYYLSSNIHINLEITVGKGFRSNSDIDNRIKGILDLLTFAGVIQDDSARHLTSIFVRITDANFKNKHQAFADVTVIGSSDGFQRVQTAKSEASPPRSIENHPKGKRRRRPSKGGETFSGPA